MSIDRVHFEMNVYSGDAAMVDDPHGEVVRHLRDLADRIETQRPTGDRLILRDVNGNKVGSAYIDMEEE